MNKILTGVVAAFLVLAPFTAMQARVYRGSEVFLQYFVEKLVKGKRVGLITNPTGVNARLQSTADIFKKDRRINLTALFAPEHGIRGNVPAGEHFLTSIDPNTGLVVYSLYDPKSRTHRPPADALAKVDVLIYDIQDTGSRSYTYIWHLAEVMAAAAAAGKEVIVFDTPNPLGATVVDGPIREEKYKSFIGLHPIPCVYGMTVGELARFMNKEFKINCTLKIVPMVNYKRGMSWAQTGLPWVPTSPQIPSPESACLFATTGVLGELGIVSMGVFYTIPFQVITAPWIDARHMTAWLNSQGLPGCRFREIHIKPYFGLFEKQNTHGVQIYITNTATYRPLTTTAAILCYLQKYCLGKGFRWRPERIERFDKAVGTDEMRKMIQRGYSYRQVANAWQRELDGFRAKRRKYLIPEYDK